MSKSLSSSGLVLQKKDGDAATTRPQVGQATLIKLLISMSSMLTEPNTDKTLQNVNYPQSALAAVHKETFFNVGQ